MKNLKFIYLASTILFLIGCQDHSYTEIFTIAEESSSSQYVPVDPNDFNKETITPQIIQKQENKTIGSKTYPVLTVGSLWWMAASLNEETPDSYCYNDNEENCNTYGRLYTQDAAKNACSSLGWRLPTTNEWETLFVSAGALFFNNEYLFSGPNNLNTYGFQPKLGGFRREDGNYFDLGSQTLFWASESSEDVTISNDVASPSTNNPFYGFYVRCVKY